MMAGLLLCLICKAAEHQDCGNHTDHRSMQLLVHQFYQYPPSHLQDHYQTISVSTFYIKFYDTTLSLC